MSRITEAARGETCQIRYPGVCNHDPEMSVWAHANSAAAGKGVSKKALDLLGTIACSACHDLYDRRGAAWKSEPRAQVELAFWEGHARSLVILAQKGVIPC